MNTTQQIQSGRLVCPVTHQPLSISDDGQWLSTARGERRYRFLDAKVPVLLADEAWAERYAASSEKMLSEYRASVDSDASAAPSIWSRIKARLISDYRSPSSILACKRVFEGITQEHICLAVGGGPGRVHPLACNLNIGPFANVQVVADAHKLPYADNSVDAAHSEAVFEHLYDPTTAAREMFRVMKPGALAFVCTPFLQSHHGYPHHYQNYTVTGHARLFETAGFKILESGSCVGPVYTMFNLTLVFIREYFPYPLNTICRLAWEAAGILIRPLDIIMGRGKNSFVLASTTYVLIQKPGLND